MTDQQYAEVQRYADKEEVSIAEVVRMALRQFMLLNKNEKNDD